MANATLDQDNITRLIQIFDDIKKKWWRHETAMYYAFCDETYKIIDDGIAFNEPGKRHTEKVFIDSLANIKMDRGDEPGLEYLSAKMACLDVSDNNIALPRRCNTTKTTLYLYMNYSPCSCGQKAVFRYCRTSCRNLKVC